VTTGCNGLRASGRVELARVIWQGILLSRAMASQGYGVEKSQGFQSGWRNLLLSVGGQLCRAGALERPALGPVQGRNSIEAAQAASR